MGVKIPVVAKQYAGIFGMGIGVLVQQVLQRKILCGSDSWFMRTLR